MINDIYDMDTQKKVRYVSESSSASTSGYSTVSPGPGGAVGNISPSTFSMPPSPALSPAMALQNDFSNLNLPSNSPQQHQHHQQQQQQHQFITLQNVNNACAYGNLNYGTATTTTTTLNTAVMNMHDTMQYHHPVSAAYTTTASSGQLHHQHVPIKSEYTAQLSILEQPTEKFRFRYKSEMHGTHGSLNGVNSKRTPKTFPEVQLLGFSGHAVILCSLFQTDIESPHSHQLVVRKDDTDICDPHKLHVSPEKGYVAQFQNMGIIHTAKKFIYDELLKKKKNRLTFELGRTELSKREELELHKETEKEAKAMNLNQVRLCFEAFKIEEDKTWTRIAAPIYTHSINNRKSAQTGELRICRLSIATGNVTGGDDLILLVEKVSKKNIKVRFYEINEDEDIVWEAFGKFRESDVHHQYAIVCTTPPYKSKDIEKPVEVFIELVRPSDDERSFPPVTFRYKPHETIVSRKRRRTCSTATTNSGSSSNSMSSYEVPKTVQEQTAAMQPPQQAPTTQQPTMMTQYQQQSMMQQYHQQQHQTMMQQHQQHGQIPQHAPPPTISEEFDKTLQLKNLYNSEEFRQILRNDSEELFNMCKDSIFGEVPLEGFLEQDGVSSTSSASLLGKNTNEDKRSKLPLSANFVSFTPNMHLERIFKIYQEARRQGVDKERHAACAKKIAEIFHDFATKNDDFDSIMHEIIMTDRVNDGIKTCEVLKYFNLQDTLNKSVNANGESCLHCACLHNKAHFIRPLLLLGCDPNIQDHIGNTALHIAVQENYKNCIESFLSYMLSSTEREQRVNLKLTNDAGLSPLHLAIRENAMDLIEKLLRYDKNAALVRNTMDGNNALHMAVLYKNVPLIKLLVDLRIVNSETPNSAGRTALELTKTLALHERKEILELLQQENKNPISKSPTIIKEEEMSSSSSATEDDEEDNENKDKPLELVMVKEETSDSLEENQESNSERMDAKLHSLLCDEKNFALLSRKLDKAEKWQNFVKLLKMQHLLCLWSSASAMLTYVRDNVKSIGYSNFFNALETVDKESFMLLRDM